METKSARAECSPTLSPAVRGRALVDAWRLSGMSLSAFARHHQVRKQRIYYWSKRMPPSTVTERADPAPIAPPNLSQSHFSRSPNTPGIFRQLICRLDHYTGSISSKVVKSASYNMVICAQSWRFRWTP